MVLELSTQSPFPDHIVKDIVKAALKSEAVMARLRYEQFAKECQSFEQRFQMTTDQFLAEFDAGKLGDAEEYFDWFAAARGRAVWMQKAQVLIEVAA
ncbi:MAG: hypothetical protein HY868_16165 [Chloroflexi bacterium]|nr:hypothetical protein [Chloroflexota bacterium]